MAYIEDMSDVKLKDLRYLVAIADERHFGKAAQRCFVSQPTLSAQLRKLEEYLGVTLIERQPKRVTLTEAGGQVVARARRMLQDSDAIVDIARHNRDPLSGALKVALIPTIGPYLLPRVAPRIRRALPRLKLLLYEYRTERLLQALHEGSIELGILALPVEQDGLESRLLFAEPFRVAVPADHPLAARKTLKPDDLDDETLLLLEDGHCLRDQALEVCSRTTAHESGDYRATSLETLRQMVAAGHGVTLLPDMATRSPFGNPRSLAVRPFAAPAPMRQVGAVWRKSSTREAAIRAVCDIIVAEGAP
jgi:LysR family hydrogen peroxide-inducible transcriptional activator